jgi:hypothetical protein
MYRTDITYENFDGEQITETCYFNLTKAEMLQLQLQYPEGYHVYLQRLVDDNNRKAMIDEFKRILAMSYGERSADGRKFIKSEEISNAFMASEAYSEIFLKLISEEGYADKFMSAVMPKDIVAQLPSNTLPASK